MPALRFRLQLELGCWALQGSWPVVDEEVGQAYPRNPEDWEVPKALQLVPGCGEQVGIAHVPILER